MGRGIPPSLGRREGRDEGANPLGLATRAFIRTWGQCPLGQGNNVL